MTPDDLLPLTEAEARQWAAARDHPQDDPVTCWRYLNDPPYHARVYIWEHRTGCPQLQDTDHAKAEHATRRRARRP